MKVSTFSLLLLVFASAVPLYGGGASDSASPDRGEYLADQGQVIPPGDIRINSYVSHIDYGYDDPSGALGVTILTGHRTLSTDGDEELIQIGIQGHRHDFAELPPFNLSFVFDVSGSMGAPDKIAWVRDGLEILLSRLRDQDYLSVVAYSETPHVILPSTPVKEIRKADVLDDVLVIQPWGVSDHTAGLRAAYQEVRRRYDDDQYNRILFLSDGIGARDELRDIASAYREAGVHVSSIGVGESFDVDIMTDLGRAGGGSSRFLSGPQKILETFDAELDRLAAEVATNLEMELRVAPGVRIVDTWGYDHVIDEDHITFAHPAVHNRDYETILVLVRTPPGLPLGRRRIATFSISFNEPSGRRIGPRNIDLSSDFSGDVRITSGIIDPRALLSVTILDAALGLKEIGTLQDEIADFRLAIRDIDAGTWDIGASDADTPMDAIRLRERRQLDLAIHVTNQRCLDLSHSLRNRMENVHHRLENDIFEGEIGIFESYIGLFGQRLSLPRSVVDRLLDDRELAPVRGGVSDGDRVEAFLDDLLLPVEMYDPVTIAVAGFVSDSSDSSQLKRRIDAAMRNRITEEFPGSKVVDIDQGDGDAIPGSGITSDGFHSAAEHGAGFAVVGRIIDGSKSTLVIGNVHDLCSGRLVTNAQVILRTEKDPPTR